MTKYLSGEPFSVPSGGRDPKDCSHGWKDKKGRCVMCGWNQDAKDEFVRELAKMNPNRDWNAALENVRTNEQGKRVREGG